jgi:hypothetical protein
MERALRRELGDMLWNLVPKALECTTYTGVVCFSKGLWLWSIPYVDIVLDSSIVSDVFVKGQAQYYHFSLSHLMTETDLVCST